MLLLICSKGHLNSSYPDATLTAADNDVDADADADINVGRRMKLGQDVFWNEFLNLCSFKRQSRTNYFCRCSRYLEKKVGQGTYANLGFSEEPKGL